MASDSARMAVVSRMTPYAPELVSPFAGLIEALLHNRMSAVEFETSYLRKFKNDTTNWPQPIYEFLNEVFLDVDAFYPDRTIRGEFVIDEAELRRRVERSLAALHAAR